MSNQSPTSWQPPGATPPPPPPPQPAPSGPPSGWSAPAGSPPPPYAPPTFDHGAYGVPPGFGSGRPPRPGTKVAGILMIVGSVLMAVGCFVPWLSVGDMSWNGFDDSPLGFDDDPAIGAAFIFFALVLVGFGIATLVAGRILAIMIIGIVVAALSLLGSLGEFSDYSDLARADVGAGLPLIILGSGVALGGAIAGCAKRRRWPASH